MAARTATRRPRQGGRAAARLPGGVGTGSIAVFAGAMPNSSQGKQVNAQQINEAVDAANNSILVRSVLAKIVADVVDCGMEVWLTYGGERFNLRESETAIIEHDWREFVRRLLWCLEVVGVAVVGRDARDGRPFVVPYRHVRVMFVESATRIREYWAEEVGSTSSGGQTRRMNARVLVRHAPDADGALTSPGYTCLPHARALEGMHLCQRYADYTRTHPTWTYEPDRDAKARPDPSEYDTVYEGQVAQEYNEYQQMIARQQQQMHSQTYEHSLVAYGSMLSSMGTFAAYSAAPAEARAQPPWTNYAFVPLGTRLTTPPIPQPNPNLQAEYDMHSGLLAAAFRVPMTELELAHAARYAAQSDAGRRQWGATVRTLQAELSRMVGEVYMFANGDVMREYAASMVRHVSSLRAEAAEAMRKIAEADAEAQPRAKRRRRGDADADDDAGSPAAGSPGGDGEEQTPEQKVDAAVADVPDVGAPEKTEDGSGALQFPETAESLRRAQELLELDDSQVLAYVQQRFSVVVRFCARPNFTDPVAELAPLVQQNVLSLNNYATLAADALGVPKDMLILDDAERIKDAEHRRKLTETLTPPDAKPGAKRKAPAP